MSVYVDGTVADRYQRTKVQDIRNVSDTRRWITRME